MQRRFWTLVRVTTMQRAGECHVTSLHRIRALFTSGSVDAGFADFSGAHPGQPPALPAGTVLLISRTSHAWRRSHSVGRSAPAVGPAIPDPGTPPKQTSPDVRMRKRKRGALGGKRPAS